MASANRRREAFVTYFDELEREPWRFDFFDMMRRIERSLGASLPALPDSDNSRTPTPCVDHGRVSAIADREGKKLSSADAT